MWIERTATVLANVRSSDLIDGQSQQTMGIVFNQVAIGGLQTDSILVPLD